MSRVLLLYLLCSSVTITICITRTRTRTIILRGKSTPLQRWAGQNYQTKQKNCLRTVLIWLAAHCKTLARYEYCSWPPHQYSYSSIILVVLIVATPNSHQGAHLAVAVCARSWDGSQHIGCHLHATAHHHRTHKGRLHRMCHACIRVRWHHPVMPMQPWVRCTVMLYYHCTTNSTVEPYVLWIALQSNLLYIDSGALLVDSRGLQQSTTVVYIS